MPERMPRAKALTLGETDTLMHFIAAVPRELPHVRVFRRNILNVTASAGGRHFHAKAGIKGQADAYAIVRGGGHVEIETKAAKGTMRDAQLEWQALMRRMRIPHLELRILMNERTDDTVARWIEILARAVDSLHITDWNLE